MMGTTHQHVGLSAAVAVSAVAHLPLTAAAIVCVSSLRWSRTPDSSEKRFRVAHRTVTHWLSTCLVMAVLPVAVVVLTAAIVGTVVQYGWAPALFDDAVARIPEVMRQVSATSHGHEWHGTLSEFVTGAALIVGFFVAMGRVCAMVAHTLADACTPCGSPLWGLPGLPRTQRPVHLLPHWLRVKTDSVDDTAVGWLALGATALVVWLSLRGLTLPGHEEVASR
jgi:hypothetical protein